MMRFPRINPTHQCSLSRFLARALAVSTASLPTGAGFPRPENSVAENAAAYDTGAGTGGESEPQPSFSRTRARSAAAAASAAAASPRAKTAALPRGKVESESRKGRSTSGTGRGEGSDRFSEALRSEEDAEEEDSGSSDRSASSDDQDRRVAGGSDHVVRLALGEEGGDAPSPPRSPLGLSPRNSGERGIFFFSCRPLRVCCCFGCRCCSYWWCFFFIVFSRCSISIPCGCLFQIGRGKSNSV